MRVWICTAMLLAAACTPAPPTEGGDTRSGAPGTPRRTGCTAGDTRLATTGLCPRDAASLLGRGAVPAAMPGCAWTIRETPFAADMLLYRTLRCGDTETEVEFQAGNHRSTLTYMRRAGGGTGTDADGLPLILAQVFAGHPAGRARALWETRDGIGDAAAAARCRFRRPYHADGLPGDAMIVDIARTPTDLERGDAAPACGPLGYNPGGGSIEFWRTHQGFAWFFRMGTDLWDVDPGSFTLVRRTDAGTWAPVAGTP